MATINHKRRIWLLAALSVFAAIALLIGICLVFLLDCYPADTSAIEAFSADRTIESQTMGQYTVYAPEEATVGFFLSRCQGGARAYRPLMEACASEGILCVLVEMPLYFPLMDGNAAEGIPELYPQIEKWYIGGHSLGGYAASDYAAGHTDVYDGLILLASYSAADISDTGLAVLSVYGSEDQIMNRGRYVEGTTKLPDDFTEIVIDGGCHAYFGIYNGQDGSAARNVTDEEQIGMTASAIAEFVYQ